MQTQLFIVLAFNFRINLVGNRMCKMKMYYYNINEKIAM